MTKPMGSQSRQPTIKPTIVVQPHGGPIPPGAAAVLLDMLRATKPRNPANGRQRSVSTFEP